MKNIYVFTGNSTLYNTIIRDEIEDLRRYFNVIPIVEDKEVDIDLSSYKNYINIYSVKKSFSRYLIFIIDLFKFTISMKRKLNNSKNEDKKIIINKRSLFLIKYTR